MRQLCRSKLSERGQAAVEFALVLPFLLIMLIGIVEFGRAWNQHQVITDAARETARRACLPDDVTMAGAQQVARRRDGRRRDRLEPVPPSPFPNGVDGPQQHHRDGGHRPAVPIHLLLDAGGLGDG